MILEVDPNELQPGDVIVSLKRRDQLGCEVRVTVDRDVSCAHCGQPGMEYSSLSTGEIVCHADKADRPDCYRRITVYGEKLGTLKAFDELPCGVEDVYRPMPCPECGAELEEKWSGVKCPKCPYWSCL